MLARLSVFQMCKSNCQRFVFLPRNFHRFRVAVGQLSIDHQDSIKRLQSNKPIWPKGLFNDDDFRQLGLISLLSAMLFRVMKFGEIVI